ncbi:MAG TPA: zinc ribbon domain-containing protein [Bacillota bacterium]|nr:zinc ribbon domain-containing protein [Bacillota bacterium]
MSSSSRGKLYRNGHYGSNHYQRRGTLGNLFNIFGSGSSQDHYHNHPEQYPNQPYPNQPPPNMPGQVMTCTKCNTRIPAGSKFCLQCGEKISEALFCMSCGEKLPPEARFCLKCGTKVN